jgi:osmotically-inducible protein OsmY
MDTSLRHAANLTAEEVDASLPDEQAEAEHHIHMPGPSYWPLLLSAAILFAVAGLLFFPDTPWLTVGAAPFVLLGILGWALEDPMGGHGESQNERALRDARYAKLTPEEVLDMARATVDNMVTISSTAYSNHPVTVELDSVQGQGIVLALYGKVELEAQRDAIEQAMWEQPKVINVLNFIIGEDATLNRVNAKIEELRAKGKLNGANNISVLIENYILNLYGDVPTNDMKYMLERELIGTSGVRVVVNHIGLNEDIPGNLGKTRNKI